MQSKLNMQLEGLRGLTIIFIVLYHVFCRYLQIYCDKDIVFMNRWGRIGVAIFLVVSGYLMGIKPHKKSSSYLSYIVSKIARLWPCYIVSITFIFVITNIFYLPYRTVSLFEYFINVCFVNGYIGMPYVDGAHWYLTVLLSSHLVYGIIRKFDEKCILYVCTGWMIIVGLLHVLKFGIFEMALGGSYVGYICVGIALGKFVRFEKKERLKIILFLMESMFFVYALMGIEDFIELLLIILLVGAVIYRKLKILEKKVFTYLGKISYPLYLIHQNIAYLIIYYMSIYFGEYNYWFSIISIGIVLLLAIILYNFVERPAQAFIGSKLHRVHIEKDGV